MAGHPHIHVRGDPLRDDDAHPWDGANSVIVKTRDGGDSTVNLHGAMLENQQIRFTDKNHGGLNKSDEAREALQDIFSAYGILLAHDATVSLTVSDHFVESEQPIEIPVAVTGPGAAVHGRLYLERARIDPKLGDELADADFDASVGAFARELRYDGPDLVMMNVKFEGVKGPAAFPPRIRNRRGYASSFRGRSVPRQGVCLTSRFGDSGALVSDAPACGSRGQHPLVG